MPESVLDLDAEKLSACVSCGLCLPHCPTFRVTGEEAYSPRGRIDAMRGVQNDGAPIDAEFVEFMETCVQCRGCEPACPSNVQFGALMEQTREALANEREITPWWQRLGLRALGHHRALLAGSTVLAVAQRMKLVPRRLGLAPVPLRRPAPLASTGDDVWLFTGCVMDAWQRSTHHSTAELITSVGSTYRVPGSQGACCGALHVHAGLHTETVAMAERVMASMPGDAPIVVNSAGCGAAMKEYGSIVGTPDAQRFAERVVDVNEWLAERVDQLPVPSGRRLRVLVQDPCHLRHVQRVDSSVRTLLGHVADVVELDDDGLCCGAGGAYSALEPELAGQIRDRKVASIDRALASAESIDVLASANPGCSMHLEGVLADRALPVEHPVDIVARALRS
ncbi:(Fe-S)-binding protein [Ilumatobacter nonamiensis]|uniref:(Fe-S)-binding protein n=1 Tax=Ilumatobacter nonamiensis TaxID=467093 RepID=UPI00058B66DE|nr:(Fe-S)-binding protein [Ilumatobacter nonamiensis]